MFKAVTENYITVLKWSLNNKWKVITLTIVLFFATFALIPAGFIGNEFIAVADRGEFTVTIELPPGAPLEKTNHAAQEVEKIISSIPEVKKVFTNVGASSEGLMGQSANNSAQIDVALVSKNDRKKSTDEVGEYIKRRSFRKYRELMCGLTQLEFLVPQIKPRYKL